MPRLNACIFHREDYSIESIVRKFLTAGFDGMEMSRPPFYDKLTTSGTRKRFVEWMQEQRLSMYGFDCWVNVDPFSKLEETLESFAAAIDWAADLDLGFIISHDTVNEMNGDRSLGDVLKVNVDLFRRVADMCLEKGLRLIFEPHPDMPSMNDEWGIDFVDQLGEGRPDGSVGILYDCCHYGVGQPATYVDAIRKFGRRIQHVHFSDSDRETYALHLPPGEGVLDLEAIVASLKGVGFRGSLTCDLFNYPMLEDGARRSVGAIAEVERKLGLK